MLTMLLSGALAIDIAVSNACIKLDPRSVTTLIDGIRAAPDQNDQIQALVALGAYWDGVCATDRKHANNAIVRKLSGLLKIRRARPIVTSILWDVGSNLKAARTEIRSAIRDEEMIDRAALRRTYPVMPTNYHLLRDSLSCLDKRIRTGKEDRNLCRYLREVAGERG